MRDVRRGVVLYMSPQMAERPRDDALVLRRAFHGVRFPRAGLSVREHAAVEPVEDRRHQRTDLITNYYIWLTVENCLLALL